MKNLYEMKDKKGNKVYTMLKTLVKQKHRDKAIYINELTEDVGHIIILWFKYALEDGKITGDAAMYKCPTDEYVI